MCTVDTARRKKRRDRLKAAHFDNRMLVIMRPS